MQTIRSGGPISSGLAGMWMSLAEPVKTELGVRMSCRPGRRPKIISGHRPPARAIRSRHLQRIEQRTTEALILAPELAAVPPIQRPSRVQGLGGTERP